MNNLLLAFYGDDFTGSTDVMEALASAGLPTVLFLKPPTPEALAAHPGLRAFGIAGGARAFSPEAMERELPPAFEALRASGAPIIHYKLCSTLDSSPRIGSIGKAIELGRRVLGDRPTPLVVGLPRLGRYVVFGNLFARSGLDSEPFRLDRHPTMSRHPVTPMTESDIRLILSGQTRIPVELVDVIRLEARSESPSREADATPPPAAAPPPSPIVLFDTLVESHLEEIGHRIARMARGGQLLVAGSSAVEYAMIAHWASNPPPDTTVRPSRSVPDSAPAAGSRHPLVCVSGSCSPVTDRQIARAVEGGFLEIPLDPKRLLATTSGDDPDRAEPAAEAGLRSGRSVILHTSRGTGDRRFQDALAPSERDRLGWALGGVLDRLLAASAARRAVVCGGDTGSTAARALGIEALEFAAPVAPGAPLCWVRAPGRAADGCQMIFKGGQNGRDRFLLDAERTPSGSGVHGAVFE